MKAILLLMCLSLFSCLTAESFIFPRWMKTSDSTAVSPRWTVNSDGILHWNLKTKRPYPTTIIRKQPGLKARLLSVTESKPTNSLFFNDIWFFRCSEPSRTIHMLHLPIMLRKESDPESLSTEPKRTAIMLMTLR